ncbi:hypothetical protein [Streptomyces sp. NPDC002328]|uniref:hypothetical protein n=1 Tax=Streptomyces sp. NPDC002328 TaxID=3364642 RepID=UPI0036A1D0E7
MAQAGSAAPAIDAVRLRGFVNLLPDPRDRRGRRYPLSALLCAAAASVQRSAERFRISGCAFRSDLLASR